MEELIGGGLAIEQSHDARTRAVDQPSRCVEDFPAQRLGSSVSPLTGQTQQLEPAHEVAGQCHAPEPRGVGLELGEGKGAQSRVLQSLDVALDVRVGAHALVQLRGCSLRVGVEAPVAVVGGGEEGVQQVVIGRVAEVVTKS